MKTIHNVIFVMATLLFINCSKDNPSKENENNNTVFKSDKQLIENTVNSIILPEITSFKKKCIILNELTEAYVQNSTLANLESVKKQWITVAEGYASIYAYNIGTVKNKYTRQLLYNWPSTAIAIENFIKDKEINETTITNFGSSAKGISAIEYLLFKDKSKIVNLEITTNAKRKKYLQLITKELKNNAEKQENLWKNYASEFINNQVKDGVDTSLNILFNGLNNVITFARETKIGKPAGLEKSNHTNIEILQAFYSETSINLLEKNLKSVENTLFKNGVTTIGDKISFITKNETLNNNLKSQFKNIYTAIDAIKPSLKNAITTDIKKVQKLHSELKRLEVLFIVDIRSALSLIVTGTDGDGD